MKKHAKILIIILSLQFVFGMITNLYFIPPEEMTGQQQPIYAEVAFIAHTVLGLALAIDAAVFAFKIRRSQDKQSVRLGITTCLSIILATIFGIINVSMEGDIAELSSLAMAVAFLTALISLGLVYMREEVV